VDQQERTGLAEKSPPAYEADNGPLNAEDIAYIRNAARPMLPEGKVLGTRSLLNALAGDDNRRCS
jgi:hypothetical protein